MYRVFVSQAAEDTWLAEQMARSIEELGCSTFLDVKSIPKGADFKEAVRREIQRSNELVALFTPWSAKRSWVWIELGAAWGQSKPVMAVFYGMSVNDLRTGEQGAAILEDMNVVRLNDFAAYVVELRDRAKAEGLV